jgi:hypothetical protein
MADKELNKEKVALIRKAQTLLKKMQAKEKLLLSLCTLPCPIFGWVQDSHKPWYRSSTGFSSQLIGNYRIVTKTKL